MVSLSASPTPCTFDAEQTSVTSQMMLGISRLGYSCWRLVAGYMCKLLNLLQYVHLHWYHVLIWYYVTAEQHWRPDWVGVRYHAWTHVSYVPCSPTQTAFKSTVTRTHTGQHGGRRWTINAVRQQLSQRRSFATWKTLNRWPIGERVPPCRPPHANYTSFNSVSQRLLWHLAVAVSFRRLPPTATAVGGVGGRPRRLGRSVFNDVAHCLLFFTKSISVIRRRRFVDVLACSDVADFWCPMYTSAELYLKWRILCLVGHKTLINQSITVRILLRSFPYLQLRLGCRCPQLRHVLTTPASPALCDWRTLYRN